jgi:molecular chaperone IbpA
MLDKTTGFETSGTTYPPYNIERTGENSYRVTIAVAGFAESELTVEAKESTLTVKGEKAREADPRPSELLYQGIAARAFERVFRLADFVEVKAAKLQNGLLHIDLVREIPETMKPRTIRIDATQNGKVIDTKAAA